MKIDLKKLLGIATAAYLLYQSNKPQIDGLVRAGRDAVKPKPRAGK